VVVTWGWVRRQDLGRGERDVEAELHELCDEPAGLAFRVPAASVVVVAEVVVDLAGGEHLPDEVAQAVGEGDRALFGPRRLAIWRYCAPK
jgi:hypothetical protein